MPMVIRYIDQIAREKSRDILFMQFNPKFIFEDDLFVDDILVRNKILAWLEKQQVDIEFCGPSSNSDRLVGYFGNFYIDVPYDEENPTYQKIQQYLEDENGQMKPEFKDSLFCYYKLTWAKKLAYTDEPGYWDNF